MKAPYWSSSGRTMQIRKELKLLKRTKQARVEQIILSGMLSLSVFRGRNHGYRHSRRVAVNGLVQQLFKEEEAGFVDL